MNWRSEKLLKACRKLACQHCGADNGTVVAAHSNWLRDGKARSMKAHDYRVAALCYTCHMELDQGSKMSKAERMEMWEEAHRKTIGQLFEQGLVVVK